MAVKFYTDKAIDIKEVGNVLNSVSLPSEDIIVLFIEMLICLYFVLML